MKHGLGLIVGLLIWLLPIGARGQGEYSNWFFGQRADLHFAAGVLPQASLSSAMPAPSGCATLSDAAGNLQLYTNGDQVWNRQHQLMAGSQGLGGRTQVAQGCAVLRVTGSSSPLAYIFTQLTAQPSLYYATGTPVATEVQLSGASGLGQVARTNQPVVADTVLQRLGESQFSPYQALIRHANGRDCWLLMRLHEQGVFLATLIDGAGQWPCARTVVSRVFPRRIASAATWGGALVAAPDGHSIIYNDVALTYLLQFDPATGRVSAPQLLAYPALTLPSSSGFNPYCLGVCFSPDGSRAYVNRLYEGATSNGYGYSGIQVVQFDLVAGNPAAVAASGIDIYSVVARSIDNRLPWYPQRGLDGIIYYAVPGAAALDAILQPNARGKACRYAPAYQTLSGRTSNQALPTQPNDVNLGSLLQTTAAFGCVGQAVLLQANAGGNGAATDSLRWDLGNGRAVVNTPLATTSLTVAYAAAGTFTLRIERIRVGQVVATATAAVRISPAPSVRLAQAADTAGCAPLSLRLSVGVQPAGSVFSWQDGSSGPTLLATKPGPYWVDVQNASGCTVRATVEVKERACGGLALEPGAVIPNIITPNGDGANDAFAPKGLPSPAAWALAVFDRWGRRVHTQAAYDNTWAAAGQSGGLYYFLLTNATTGQQLKGWLEVVR
ncbi:MAG: hypothetical protein JWP58_3176 [Hymenobacter sp.]|nr:hypothetical protein [Hymenobacter sp.]